MSLKLMYLAIDGHARNSTLGCMDARGQWDRSWDFRTSEKELIRHIKQIGTGKKILTLEEGPLAYWMAQTLKPYVEKIIICNPRENASISRNAKKSDKSDVKQLCRLLRLGELKSVYHPEKDDRAIFKSVMKQYMLFRDRSSTLKVQIKAKYRSWGIMDVVDTKRVYSEEGRKEFLKMVKLPAVQNQLLQLYTLMDMTEEVRNRALNQAKCMARKYPEIIQFKKIPGISDINAMIFDAYIQTPHRFGSKSALYRYCKLGVIDRTSDGKPLGYKRLDKAGNHELKRMSYSAYVAALRTYSGNEVKAFFHISLQNTKNRTAARLNTQRKIISVMHGIWRKGEEYRPELFLRAE